MGSDDLNLRVLSTSSDNEKERKNAGKVLRLLGRGRHWVLVVLLLSNVVSTSPPLDWLPSRTFPMREMSRHLKSNWLTETDCQRIFAHLSGRRSRRRCQGCHRLDYNDCYLW